AHEVRVGSEPEEVGIVDEQVDRGPAAATAAAVAAAAAGEEARLRAVPSLLGATPAGAEVGTLVHAVLEGCDFAAPDLEDDLAARVDAERLARNLDVGDPALLVAGLRAAVESPLGPLAGGRRLRDVARADRLDELSFELPLVGGDRPAGGLTVAAVAGVLARHVPPGDALAGYAARLADPALAAALRGYLTGSIDLVLRLPAPDGTPRFAVVDHKTNWLGPEGEPLSSWHYRPAALAEAMQRAHYPLQALLYSVALHRFLRWRLSGYDAERNLAGVLYLFLRGMSGVGVPLVGDQPCGVFAWSPPPGLVAALSDLLDRGTTEAGP
ncbi:MAG TPA: PD-(D/E)XK nuclease family protein, partial [Acidimicrobiales bacterium]|nr:PD-(D/E)XK nuclease family protein [Acidimicrobiales bacterium]